MKKIYKLIIDDVRGISIPIKLGEKRTDFKTSLKRGVNGKSVHQVNIDDDGEIVHSYSTYYEHKDPETGEKRMYEIDKGMIDELFKNVDEMKVLNKLSECEVPWDVLDGNHYPIYPYEKQKTRDDDKIYQGIVYGLNANKYCFLVSFISFKRPRFGIIRAYETYGLALSFLHGSNFLRDYKPAITEFSCPDEELKYISSCVMNLVKDTEDGKYPFDSTIDTYEEELIRYISQVISGDIPEGKSKKFIPETYTGSGVLGKLFGASGVECPIELKQKQMEKEKHLDEEITYTKPIRPIIKPLGKIGSRSFQFRKNISSSLSQEQEQVHTVEEKPPETKTETETELQKVLRLLQEQAKKDIDEHNPYIK